MPPPAAPDHHPRSRGCGRLSLVALVLLTGTLVACLGGANDEPATAPAPTETTTSQPPITLDAILAALAGAGYPALRGGNSLGCAPARGQVDPVAGQDYRAGDASFHVWVYPSAAELLARWDVGPDRTARPKPTSGCPALPATYANQNIVIAFERPDPPQAALDAVLNAR